jgi:hypothetical protein
VPSLSLDVWQTSQSARLDELESAHQSVGGHARGRRFATQQLNRAYALLLAAQFQGYCSNFHSECAFAILATIPDVGVRGIVRANLLFGRNLDRGNAGPGNIGNDFGRLGVSLWPALYGLGARNQIRNQKTEQLNTWRNAIAHDDFRDRVKFPQGRDTALHLSRVRDWRRTCNKLAIDMDRTMGNYLTQLLGHSPW